jgi:3'(2'), 5'-bisphosphate nucleotidase
MQRREMSTMSIDKHALAEAFCSIAERAGHEILRVYHGDFEVRSKADFSPVTDADERAERLIIESLSEIAPGIPVIAEESVAAGRVPEIGDGPFLLVDPLDGTKEFVSRNGEFTVNIALIENARAVLGVVHLPVLTETYWTNGDGEAWRSRSGERAPIHCRTPSHELVAVASRSHSNPQTDEYLARYPIKERISAGSSLKFCRIAEGVADIYPRIGRTMEWDIAAGHAVLAAAGGRVMTLDNEPLRYGKPGFENPPIVAWGLEDPNEG